MAGRAGAFAGLNVVDLTEGFAGALCTMMLADNGAAVVRVVAPAHTRRDPTELMGSGWRQWHRAKQLHELGEFGLDVARLVCEADVVVVSRGGVVADALGLEASALAAADPALVVAEIGGLGREHPLHRHAPAYEALAAAAFGRMHDYGRTARAGRPIYVAQPLAGFGAGHAAFHGICAALHVRHRTGRGGLVGTDLLRGLTPFDFWGPPGMPNASNPAAARTHPALGYATARTSDGKWLQFANWAPHLLWALLDTLGLGHLRDDPECAKVPAVSDEVGHRIWEQMLASVAQKTAHDWMQQFRASGVAGCDVIGTTAGGMDHPQIRHNGDVIVVDGVEQIGRLARHADPVPIAVRDWNPARRVPAEFGAAPTGARKPLDGVVLLEAASMIATPVGSLALADLGARIIKIEPIGGEPGRVLPFAKTFYGKESICVDLKSPEGIAIVHQLTARADMFLHNYRPGVPAKLGIDYETLRRHNEALIYVYAGAYGSDGPYAKMPGYHPIAGAVCGAAAAQAGAGALDRVPADLRELKAQSQHLFVSNEGHPDPVTGLVVASVLLAALVEREQTGQGGEHVVSMLGANALLMSDDWYRAPDHVPRPLVDADQMGTGPFHRLYPTADGWVFVAALFPDEQARLLALVGAADAADLGARLATRGADEVEAECLAAGLGVVRADRSGSAQFQQSEIAAGRTALSRYVAAHDLWRAAPLVDIDGAGEVGGACQAGEHTRSILAELGYGAAQIDELVDRRVVAG